MHDPTEGGLITACERSAGLRARVSGWTSTLSPSSPRPVPSAKAWTSTPLASSLPVPW